MDYDAESEVKTNKEYGFIQLPEYSDWKCYMFGNRPGGSGLVYCPRKDQVPNFFVRAMMRICFDCLWVKEKK